MSSIRWCRCLRSGENGDLPARHAPDDGEAEVEQRQQHDDDRQQDRDERTEQLRPAELVVVADHRRVEDAR